MAEEPDTGERITEAELAVMECLWTASPLGATDLAGELKRSRGWGLATVKTLLSRLVAKQAIAAEPEGRRFLYTPRIARADYLGGEAGRMVDRLFGGSAASLFAHLAESEALDSADIAKIEALLKELKS